MTRKDITRRGDSPRSFGKLSMETGAREKGRQKSIPEKRKREEEGVIIERMISSDEVTREKGAQAAEGFKGVRQEG